MIEHADIRLAIGPAKTGSTWLYDALATNRGIRVGLSKEVNFFTDHYARGINWYRRQFRSGDGPIVDVCHDYIVDPQVPLRVGEHFANPVFAVTVRNPVDRAVSDYAHMHRQGRITCSFKDAVDTEPRLVGHGQYDKLLEPFLQRWGRQSLAFLQFDDLAVDPGAFYCNALDVLSLPTATLPSNLEGAVNSRRDSRVPKATALLRAGGRSLQRAGLHRVVHHLKRSRLTELLLYKAPSAPDAPLDGTARVREETYDAVVWLESIMRAPLRERWGYL